MRRYAFSLTTVFYLTALSLLFVYHQHHPSTVAPTAHHCTPRRNIVLLKTHKCASSAVQNIFLRYGHTHNLTFALPYRIPRVNYFHPLEAFHPSMALPLDAPSSAYNILCHHTRFSPALAALMPPDTVFVTILRQPSALFESAFSFFNLPKRFGANLTTFLQDPERYFTFRPTIVWSRFGRNPAMYDAGLEVTDYDNDTAIAAKIRELDARFDLVMLAEEMEASLVLLRELLCWEWQDVVTFRVNARPPAMVTALTETEVEKINEWNHADTLLYEHFRRKFQERKARFGAERLDAEVKTLKGHRTLAENVSGTIGQLG
ncbi:galactosylceramide sulfotransferase-like [Paramacrobiotus metropolitanus]|uniref:galactosylceramide sulfotransferase-like n=1 Tax=Paramacrobiotus metropolitanus TaxID=2943436 RepID=UPI002445C834|nr:galactosylceramide sulfotransferase-like [Paramacrobiotus metropolitanus]